MGGGVLRELEKSMDSSCKAMTGQEEKLSGMPVVGRLKGEVDPARVKSNRYFERSRSRQAPAQRRRRQGSRITAMR